LSGKVVRKVVWKEVTLVASDVVHETYETPQLVLLGDADHLVEGWGGPELGDSEAQWWC
jgi:hypothetical protein